MIAAETFFFTETHRNRTSVRHPPPKFITLTKTLLIIKALIKMMMKLRVADEIKGTPVVRMLFRDWNCYQVYLRWDHSGKVFCVT